MVVLSHLSLLAGNPRDRDFGVLLGCHAREMIDVDDTATDIIIVRGGRGKDTVIAEVNYVLATDVAAELLQTASNTAKSAIDLTGNALARTIEASAGRNTLHDGGTGAADTLRCAGFAVRR
ncbi:hypothetical protein [Rhizobium giardinii]|uniref:hypothetical protein n=1 Tax=Rhizobium giardinii TaxID=56731 RepID=UPI003D6FDCD9